VNTISKYNKFSFQIYQFVLVLLLPFQINATTNFWASLPIFHAFHTSITQVEYNTKAKTFEISVRLFTDDFETALDFENKIKGIKIVDGDKNDALVAAYVTKHFTIISPQNKRVIYKYIGKENEDLATWVYLELPADQLLKGSKIEQVSMMELFDDQVNILNFRNGEERKTLLFDSKNKMKVLD
jgi:hypothetical protein